MVQIRVVGPPAEVDAATELLCSVTTVSRVDGPHPANLNGGVLRYLTASILPMDCFHPVGTIVRRGSLERLGDARYAVEYGMCAHCEGRIVRVVVESGGELRAVGSWSALIETPRACTAI